MNMAMTRSPSPARLPRPPWRWAVAGTLLGLLLALLGGAPAHWLGSAVRWATLERVQLQSTRGTVWSGSASLVLSGGADTQDRRSLPGRIQWHWGLAWPGLSLQLSADCCTPQPLQWRLLASAQGWQLQLQDQRSQWPVAVLAGLGAPWDTLQAEGLLQWHSEGLQWRWQAGRLLWHGDSQWQVQQLGSRLSTLRPMGSYRIALQGSADGTTTPALTLATLQGPLQLQGQGQWLGQRLRFTGEAWADEGAETALSNLLNIIGRRDGSRSRLSLG